jgi:diaminopimelate epimerase
MCGNAIRCVGVYLHKKTKKNTFTIQTDSGIKEVKTHKNSCTVTMGKPIFELEKIPCLYPQNPVPLSINNDELSLFVVSMGNPHAVIEVKNLEDPITTWGALIETQAIFPQKTNVEFVKFIDKNRIAIKVWERGVGYTQACGTGACASAVAMICLKKCTSPVTVDFTEGSLLISWNDNENVLMEGPANLVFTGQC